MSYIYLICKYTLTDRWCIYLERVIHTTGFEFSVDILIITVFHNMYRQVSSGDKKLFQQ